MTTDIQKYLDNLSSDWQAIKNQVRKYFDEDSKVREDGAVQVFRRPWVAPPNYGLLLFPPTSHELLKSYGNKNDRPIPKFYSDILLQMNGCFVYDFSLFGLPGSLYTTGLLSRNSLNQLEGSPVNRTV